VSHMRVSDHRINKVNHGTWRQRDPADLEAHTQAQPRQVLPTTASTHFREGRTFQAPYQRHLGDDDNVGTSPSQFTRNRGHGHRDMRTDAHRDHHWLFEEREADDDNGGYAMMGGPIKSPSNIECF
jgi:hypothetical protein